MSHIYHLFIISGLVLLSSCSSFQVLPPDYKGDSITFGQGGGFVGRETAHVLLDNGELYKLDYQMNFTPHKKIDQSLTDQMFENVAFLKLMKVNYMNPGNTYEFIEIKQDDQTNRISWNDQSKAVPQDFIKFYKVLSSLTENTEE